MKFDAIPISQQFRDRNANIVPGMRRREKGAPHQRSTPLSQSPVLFSLLVEQ